MIANMNFVHLVDERGQYAAMRWLKDTTGSVRPHGRSYAEHREVVWCNYGDCFGWDRAKFDKLEFAQQCGVRVDRVAKPARPTWRNR
jgi:hypothetical protein